MISKTVHNIRKPQFRRKIRSKAYLLVLQYINRSVTKNFPIKTLLEMIDSGIENVEEVEYDE